MVVVDAPTKGDVSPGPEAIRGSPSPVRSRTVIARGTPATVDDDRLAAGGEPAPWGAATRHVVRQVAAGVLAGLVGGFLVGGVGGRIAMRVVALQTTRFQGLTTDDGARTGEISLGGTAVLISFVTLVGVLGALVYVAVRPLLPRHRRPWVWSAVTGIVGASMVVHSDGVDYTLLGSRWVSVAMFSGLCVAYGAVTAAVAERLLRPGGLVERTSPSRLAASFVVLLPGLVIVPVALASAVAVAARATGLPPRAWRPPVALLGRALIVLAVLAASADLMGTMRDLA